MKKQTITTVIIRDLTPEQFANGMLWFAHNAVSYEYHESELYFTMVDVPEEQITALEDAIQNGFTPPPIEPQEDQ